MLPVIVRVFFVLGYVPCVADESQGNAEARHPKKKRVRGEIKRAGLSTAGSPPLVVLIHPSRQVEPTKTETGRRYRNETLLEAFSQLSRQA